MTQGVALGYLSDGPLGRVADQNFLRLIKTRKRSNTWMQNSGGLVEWRCSKATPSRGARAELQMKSCEVRHPFTLSMHSQTACSVG